MKIKVLRKGADDMKEKIMRFGVVICVLAAVFLFPKTGNAAGQAAPPIFAGNEKVMYLDGKNRVSVEGENIVSVEYASSNKNIATVSKKGLVVPKRKGKTTIRANVVYKKKAAGKKQTAKLSYKLTVLGKAGEYFKYSIKNGHTTYEIKGLTQKGKECRNLYVPGYIGGRKVTLVGWGALPEDAAFRSLHLADPIQRWWRGSEDSNPYLKKLYLGKSMKKFGYSVYLSGCPSLKESILDSRNQDLVVEESVLFSKDKRTLWCYPAQKEDGIYEIPDEVSKIANNAFNGCKSLKQVVFTENLESIGYKAFAGSGLITVTMTDEISYLNESVFSGCTSLSEVRLSKKLSGISEELFKGCISLKSLTIPARVSWINNRAFDGCTQLTQVEVSSASRYFQSKDGIVFSKDGERLQYYPEGKKDSSYAVPEGIKEIEERAFYGNTSLKEVTLPEGVETINTSVFSGCTGLMKLNLPDSVHTIQREAFKNCAKLTEVRLPDRLTEIPNDAFAYCTGLVEITIPKEVSSVGSRAFLGCSNLKRFLADSQNTTFTAVDGVLFSRSMQVLYCYPQGKADESYAVPDSVKRLKEGAFAQAKWLKKAAVPDTVKYIEERCFQACESLETVKLPKNLKMISESLFEDCSMLQTVKIPSSAEKISLNAFKGCTGLTEIKIPNSVKEIAPYAFQSCKKLKTVTIGSGVEYIGLESFAKCRKMKKMTVKTLQLKDNSIGSDVFLESGIQNGKGLTLEVPKSKKSLYTSYFRKRGFLGKVVAK